MTHRKPNLRPVREVTPSLQFRTVHGYRRAFRIAGSGPVILLIHGIGDNSTTWETVQAKLAQRFTVIAVDLLGHGQSDKPRADYSIAAYANGMRDLLSVLDIERATVVGHSLGGGVAMQFAYQFPQLVERLVLVARRRCHQGRQRRVEAGVIADGQRGAGAAAAAIGAADLCRSSGARPAWCWDQPDWATTCRTCCECWPTYRSRWPPRHSPGHCGRWWTGVVRWSPCWTDVI